MQLQFYKVHSKTKPDLLDQTSSQNVVYIRRSINEFVV